MGSDPTISSTLLSHAAGLSTASVVLMVPLRNVLLWKILTPKGESQTARPLQRGLWRERDGKCCFHSFNSFKGHFTSRRFHWDDFFSSLVLQPCQMPITAKQQICQFSAIIGRLIKLTVRWLKLCCLVWALSVIYSSRWDLHIYDLNHTLPNCFPAGKEKISNAIIFMLTGITWGERKSNTKMLVGEIARRSLTVRNLQKFYLFSGILVSAWETCP